MSHRVESKGPEDEFKNFHRLLCERFGYVHDETDWKRDQLSLIEHISAQEFFPAILVEKEPDYWSGGHFYEGSKPWVNPLKVRDLPIGTKLFIKKYTVLNNNV